jgi:hypothetical protein
MKLVNFRRLKSAVGHEHVNVKKIEIFINYQLIKINFTLDKIWTGNKTVAVDNGRNGATERDSGDRETVPGDQGGAEVPDVMTSHKVERPVTHVKTECKK